MADSAAATTHSVGLRANQCVSPTCSVCALCGTFENLSLCSSCKDTWYCSKDHQRSHWRDHKPGCKHKARQIQSESNANEAACAAAIPTVITPASTEPVHVSVSCGSGGGTHVAYGNDEAQAAEAASRPDTVRTCPPHANCHVDTPTIQITTCVEKQQSSTESGGDNNNRGSSPTSATQSESDLDNTPDGKSAAELCKLSQTEEGEKEQELSSSCYISMTPNKNVVPNTALSAARGISLSDTYSYTTTTSSYSRPSCQYTPPSLKCGIDSRLSPGVNLVNSPTPGEFVKFTGSLSAPAESHLKKGDSEMVAIREKSEDVLSKQSQRGQENQTTVVEAAATTRSKSTGGKKRVVQVQPNELKSTVDIKTEQMRYLDPRSHQAHTMPRETVTSHAESTAAETKLVDYVVRSLNNYGLCVVDNFMGEERSIQILQEGLNLYQMEDMFQEGQLVQSTGTTQRIRGDKIAWVDGTEPQCTGIDSLIQRLDKLLLGCKGRFQNKDVSGRTKAMVACYPGQGTGYKRHVDNPNGDGRCITVIYYLNRNWDVKTHGGLLRIFPQQFQQVADIEPKLDRLLFFWSDRRNPHEVHPSFRTRFAITVWYFDTKERNDALKRRKLQGSQHDNA